jgi:hypothetical protein
MPSTGSWRQRRAPHVEDRDRHIEHEVEGEERLHDRVVRGVVELGAHTAPSANVNEAHRIESAPRFRPRQREDRRVQHSEVTEQMQRIPVVADQNGGEKAAGDAGPPAAASRRVRRDRR